jgi:hypothetical protein
VIRRVGAVLAEQSGEWAVAHRCISRQALRQSQSPAIDNSDTKEEPAQPLSMTG